MKKQLLIAAVAATMTSAAMADIAISGDAKVNYTNVDHATGSLSTSAFKHDINMTLAGKSGDTGVVVRTSTTASAHDSVTAGTVLTLEDAYVTTKVGSVNIKTGQFNATSNSMISDATNSSIEAGQFVADTTIGGVKVTFLDQNARGEALTLSGEFAGVSLSHKMGNADAAGTNDYTDTKVSGSVAGVSVAYRTKQFDDVSTSDLTSLELSGEFNGVALTYAEADADTAGSFSTEGVLGTYGSINNIKGVKASMALAGNTVSITSASTEATHNAATSNDYTKFVVTRPLASGATFEATYTDLDAAAGSTSDTETLDLELAVKF